MKKPMWNTGVPPLYPEMKDGETVSVELVNVPHPHYELAKVPEDLNPEALETIEIEYVLMPEDGAPPDSVTWGVDWSKDGSSVCIVKRLPDGTSEIVAMEHGPKREWIGLTSEEIAADVKEHIAVGTRSFEEFARRIEASLKEKNT